MGLTRLDRLGEWNPQLFRELKGQLKRRNVYLVVASSLLPQLFIVVMFEHLVGDMPWQATFKLLNWLLPLLLLFCGVYLLISNLGNEQHRGTLNFIRLSPQSSQSILSGKLLGVPALLYLGIALAIPLHGVAGLATGVPLGWLLGVYLLWAAGCVLCYSTALLITLLNRSPGGVQAQAWAGSFLSALFGLFYIGAIDSSFDTYQSGFGLGNWQWFLLPLSDRAGLVCAWTLITLSVGTYWIWQAANRLFCNPNATLVSKRQSYWLVGSIQVWLLGFAVPELHADPSDVRFLIGSCFLFFFNPIGFLVLSMALSPHRQACTEWVRYRHQNRSTQKGLVKRSLVQDLISGEKSSALVAIAINLLITTAIWVPWILLWGDETSPQMIKTQHVLLGWLLTMTSTLLYAALIELMVFVKALRWLVGIALTGVALLVLQLVLASVLGIVSLNMPLLWVLSPVPAIAVAFSPTTTIFLAWLAQVAILGVFTLGLVRQLHKAGESTSKALLAGR
jgi:ABC-type Na+ efflux pump permease subunit